MPLFGSESPHGMVLSFYCLLLRTLKYLRACSTASTASTTRGRKKGRRFPFLHVLAKPNSLSIKSSEIQWRRPCLTGRMLPATLHEACAPYCGVQVQGAVQASTLQARTHVVETTSYLNCHLMDRHTTA